jgi:hypothetical protein
MSAQQKPNKLIRQAKTMAWLLLATLSKKIKKHSVCLPNGQ